MILSPKQVKSYNEATHRFNLWIGAVSSGKTYASIDKLIERIQHAPAGDCMILGVSRESIQRNILKDLYDRMGFPTPSAKVNETKLYGRRIYFVGCNNERAVSSIQGSTLAIAYVDEAPKMPYPAWAMLTTRIRVPGAQLLATGNPEGPAHWLKKEYIDRGMDIDLIHWDFTLEDNPSLDEAYIRDTKASLTGIFYRRLILGEWAAAHGAIYDTFDQMNIYEHPKNNPSYRIIGIDYGTTNATAAVMCAITPNLWPQIQVEAEYYWDSAKKGRSKTDYELVQDIKNFIGYRNIDAIYVDPAAASLKLELRQNNLPVIDAQNEVVLGIKIVSKFISGKNLVIQKGCNTLIEHLQSYAWDPKAADRGEDKPLKQNDHICDALRYAIASRFPHGELNHPDENRSIDQIRREVYGDNSLGFLTPNTGGYF
jgi:PBSX family phage terminase large subunit